MGTYLFGLTPSSPCVRLPTRELRISYYKTSFPKSGATKLTSEVRTSVMLSSMQVGKTR
jgi:hypothetical protein